MATYPTLDTERGSDPEPMTGPTIDRAEDGSARARSYGPDKVRITVVHPLVSQADRDTLDGFYQANRLLPYDYTSPSDGITRVMLFAAPPRYVNRPGQRFDITVEMEEA